MLLFRLGATEVELHDGYTVTRFPDGCEVHARHDQQPGQDRLARSLGYARAQDMNIHHDLAHTLLSTMLGLPHSITLRGVADNNHWPGHHLEEAAVLALQAFANAAGIDLVKVAEAHSRRA